MIVIVEVNLGASESQVIYLPNILCKSFRIESRAAVSVSTHANKVPHLLTYFSLKN